MKKRYFAALALIAGSFMLASPALATTPDGTICTPTYHDVKVIDQEHQDAIPAVTHEEQQLVTPEVLEVSHIEHVKVKDAVPAQTHKVWVYKQKTTGKTKEVTDPNWNPGKGWDLIDCYTVIDVPEVPAVYEDQKVIDVHYSPAMYKTVTIEDSPAVAEVLEISHIEQQRGEDQCTTVEKPEPKTKHVHTEGQPHCDVHEVSVWDATYGDEPVWNAETGEWVFTDNWQKISGEESTRETTAEECPAVVTPPTSTPSATPTPSASPTTSAAPAAAVIVAAPAADELAHTGTNEALIAWLIGGSALAGIVLGLILIAARSRRA